MKAPETPQFIYVSSAALGEVMSLPGMASTGMGTSHSQQTLTVEVRQANN